MAEAKINREYFLRISGVSLLMFGICLWSLYDGYVAWPRKNHEFDQVRPALLATNLSARVWISKTAGDGKTPLDAVYTAAKLKTPQKLIRRIDESKTPDSIPPDQIALYRERERKILEHIFESPLYSPDDLKSQFVMAAIAAIVALWLIAGLLLKNTKCYVADENGLYGSGFGSGTLKYSDIESMDWKLWDKKGIVRVTFKDGGCFTLDSWHFNGIKQVVETIVEQRSDLVQERTSEKVES